MRRGIILVAMVISLSCPVHWVAEAGSHRSSLSQEWQKVEARQETQQKMWKTIEREAERMFRDRNGNGDVLQTKPRGKRY